MARGSPAQQPLEPVAPKSVFGRLETNDGVAERCAMRKVNVNTADQQELDGVDGLRGHGFEIVRYREERGRFTDLRQLDEVPGLSGKVDDATRSTLTL